MMEVRYFIDSDLVGFVGKHSPNSDIVPQIDENTLTILHDGVPIAVIGFKYWWPNVASVWAHISVLAEGKGIAFVRAMKRAIKFTFEENDLRKMITMIYSSDKEAMKWGPVVGWTMEGYLTKASPDGSDLAIFTITRG